MFPVPGIPLLGLTIGQCVDRAAETFGDREAVVVTHQDVRRTYTQVLTFIDNRY